MSKCNFTPFFKAIFVVSILFIQSCSNVTSIPVYATMPATSGLALHDINIASVENKNTGKQDNFLKQEIIESLVAINNDKNSQYVFNAKYELSAIAKDSWVAETGLEKKPYQYYVRLTQALLFEYVITQNGKSIYANSFRVPFEIKKYSYYSESDAWAGIPSVQRISTELFKTAANLVKKQISPYKQTEVVQLFNGNDENIVIANRYVGIGRYDDAIFVYDQIIEQTPDKEDKASALFNKSMVLLLKGEYIEAYNLATLAEQILPGDIAILAGLTKISKFKKYKDEGKL